jgi:molecular chaperone DnaK (HSP70)
MSQNNKFGWNTDRKDLVGGVSRMPQAEVKKLLRKYMNKDSRTAEVRKLGHAQQANVLLLGLLEGSIPESAVIQCKS